MLRLPLQQALEKRTKSLVLRRLWTLLKLEAASALSGLTTIAELFCLRVSKKVHSVLSKFTHLLSELLAKIPKIPSPIVAIRREQQKMQAEWVFTNFCQFFLVGCSCRS